MNERMGNQRGLVMNVDERIMPHRPEPVRRKSSARDHYGIYMTLCIGALAINERKIVMASDFLLSTPVTSLESRAIKTTRIGKSGKWMVMFAGNPSHYKLILTHAQRVLNGAPSESGGVVMNALTSAYQEVFKKHIENTILCPLGMSRDEFIKNGRVSLGDEEFVRILSQVTTAMLATDLLAVGFDSGGLHLFSVSDPGAVSLHDSECFHAVGCGATLADASLIIGHFNPLMSLQEIIYLIAEAKFRSEAAPGVGKRTIIHVFSEDGTLQNINPSKMEDLKLLWQKGAPKMPPECSELIIKSLQAAKL